MDVQLIKLAKFNSCSFVFVIRILEFMHFGQLSMFLIPSCASPKGCSVIIRNAPLISILPHRLPAHETIEMLKAKINFLYPEPEMVPAIRHANVEWPTPDSTLWIVLEAKRFLFYLSLLGTEDKSSIVMPQGDIAAAGRVQTERRSFGAS